MYELTTTDTSPLSTAIYDAKSGELYLLFDWDKLLQATGTWGNARHIDAVFVNGKAYEIEIHSADGPKDANGFIYNQNTMWNEFTVQIETGLDPSDGTLELQLTDRANGTKPLYDFQLELEEGESSGSPVAAPNVPEPQEPEPQEPEPQEPEPQEPEPQEPQEANAEGLVYALNVGGGAFTGSNGVAYQADDLGNVRSWSNYVPISGTTDDALYQTERSEFDGGFTYEVAVANGSYEVELNFAEIWSGAQSAGVRVFDVYLEGERVIDDLDITGAAGFRTAYDVLEQVEVEDGALTIELVSEKQNAKLSGFSIWESEASSAPTTPEPTPTPAPTLTPETELPVILGQVGVQDRLTGTDADEVINARGGPVDTVRGGDGKDIFVYADTDELRDLLKIMDYEIGIDSIDLDGAAIKNSTAGNAGLYIRLEDEDRDAIFVSGVSDINDISFIG